MRKIVIINTGGTIAMAVDQESDAVKSQGNQPLHLLVALENTTEEEKIKSFFQ